MTTKQFEAFKKEFWAWQKCWGLQAYDIQFEQKPLDGTWAEISADPENYVGLLTISGNGKWTPNDIKQTACHESLHLLLNRYNHLAHSRFLKDCEMCSEEEKIVRVLERKIWNA